MAFDEGLAARMRGELRGTKRIVEKKMFGGVAFLLNGNMCVGIHKDAMIVRLEPDETAAALKEKHTRVFDLTGRPMKGWILVDAAGVKTASGMAKWVRRAAAYAGSLPKKKQDNDGRGVAVD